MVKSEWQQMWNQLHPKDKRSFKSKNQFRYQYAYELGQVRKQNKIK